MCTQLTQNGKIIVPHGQAVIKTNGGKGSDMIATWGTQSGELHMTNARLESIKVIWKPKGFHVGVLQADAFIEKGHNFIFKLPRYIGVVYKDNEFLVVTEPAANLVRMVHNRQPCFQNINLLLRA